MATEPVAIVEDINAPGLKIGMFDQLEEGYTFSLETGTIVIGYFRSCRRETIKGGTVVIGANKSTVSGGKLSYEVVECDGGAINLSTAQADRSAVAVFRATPGGAKSKSKTPNPQQTLYGSSPVIRTTNPTGTVKITRLGKPEKPVEIKLTGRLTDLVKNEIELEPGGFYRVSVGDNSVVINVDPLAIPGKAPLLTRLIRF